jgi:hypothetical protein
MIQALLLILGVTLLIILTTKIRSLPKTQQKWLLFQIGAGILSLSLLIILTTGRLHWLGPVIGALIPILRAFWTTNPGAKPEQNDQPIPAMTDMDIKEAMNILGLTGDIEKGEITEEMVIDAHRHLIQKFHPDRGGNDYLAVKINQAKDILLKRIAQ